MGELVAAFATVAAALLVHVLVWKIRVPRRQTRAILLIFFGTLGAAVLVMPVAASRGLVPGLAPPVPFAGYLHVIICVTAAALAYMMTYTVIEVDSPSLVMALAIGAAGPEGLAEAEFRAMMDDGFLVEPRIRDMVRDGLISQAGDVYTLTAKGRRMVRLFVLHRSLLGAGKGG